MSALKHLSLRGLRLFRWMRTTIKGKKKPRLKVTAQSLWLPERETVLQKKKEIKVINNTKF